MKYIIASDIHGSAGHTTELINAFVREKADGLILLGDILSPGSGGRETAHLLNRLSRSIIAVRGNCDREDARALLDFSVSDTLRTVTTGGLRLHLTHGHIYDPLDPPPMESGDILLSGHTHVPASFCAGERWFLNPGSLSLPRRGSPNSYMTLEDGVFLWKTEDGEIYRTLGVL